MPISIRLLADTDIKRVENILELAFQRSGNWTTDLQLYRKIQPDGYFLAEADRIPVGMALIDILYSFSHSIPLAITILTISGFIYAPSFIGRRLVIQRNTPRDMRGRVNSVFFVLRDALYLCGMAAAGLADFF